MGPSGGRLVQYVQEAKCLRQRSCPQRDPASFQRCRLATFVRCPWLSGQIAIRRIYQSHIRLWKGSHIFHSFLDLSSFPNSMMDLMDCYDDYNITHLLPLWKMIGHPSRHSSHVPWTRLLQRERWPGPGKSLQRHESLFVAWSWSWLLPGICFHRRHPPHAGKTTERAMGNKRNLQ